MLHVVKGDGTMGQFDEAVQALLCSTDGCLILANNSGIVQRTGGYNALNFGYFALHGLSLLGMNFNGQSVCATLGPVAFAYACKATKIQLENFEIFSDTDLVQFMITVGKSMEIQGKDNAAICQSKELPCINPDVLAWTSIFIGLCEVETVIQHLHKRWPKASPEHIYKFLVHLGKSWASARKAGQQQAFPVQDVVGQSVAILQVSAAMDALKMTDLSCAPKTCKKAGSYTQRDASVALMQSGLVQKLSWQQTPDMVEAMVVLWSALLLRGFQVSIPFCRLN